MRCANIFLQAIFCEGPLAPTVDATHSKIEESCELEVSIAVLAQPLQYILLKVGMQAEAALNQAGEKYASAASNDQSRNLVVH